MFLVFFFLRLYTYCGLFLCVYHKSAKNACFPQFFGFFFGLAPSSLFGFGRFVCFSVFCFWSSFWCWFGFFFGFVLFCAWMLLFLSLFFWFVFFFVLFFVFLEGLRVR